MRLIVSLAAVSQCGPKSAANPFEFHEPLRTRTLTSSVENMSYLLSCVIGHIDSNRMYVLTHRNAGRHTGEAPTRAPHPRASRRPPGVPVEAHRRAEHVGDERNRR